MVKRRDVIVRAGALCALVLVGACALRGDLQPPEVRLADLRPIGGGLLEQRFRVDLRLVNPNDYALDIDGLTLDLDLQGRAFASGLSNRRVRVPRLGEAVVPVEVSTSILELARQIFALAETGDLSYRISGLAYLGGIGGGQVPYERSGSLSLSSVTGGVEHLVPR
jgi:LEA14-like dessication related protein